MPDSRSTHSRRTEGPLGGASVRASVRQAVSGCVTAVALLATTPEAAVAQVRTIQPGAPGDSTRVLGPSDVSTLEVPTHTEADSRFMQGMILHHGQAIEMAALVPTRTTTQEMRLLARRIEISQIDEVRFMERWLAAKGIASDAADHATPGSADHAMLTVGMLMPGMLTPDQMSRLQSASGREFDRLFLEGMIQHHEGALAMVRDLFGSGSGQEAEISAFASHVEADQSIEIRRMGQMLSGYADPGRSPG